MERVRVELTRVREGDCWQTANWRNYPASERGDSMILDPPSARNQDTDAVSWDGIKRAARLKEGKALGLRSPPARSDCSGIGMWRCT